MINKVGLGRVQHQVRSELLLVGISERLFLVHVEHNDVEDLRNIIVVQNRMLKLVNAFGLFQEGF